MSDPFAGADMYLDGDLFADTSRLYQRILLDDEERRRPIEAVDYDGSYPASVFTPKPPTITDIQPPAVVEGAVTTIVVSGSNYRASSYVTADGLALATTQVSTNTLEARFDLPTPAGTILEILVVDGAQQSNPWPLAVGLTTPVIASIVPPTLVADPAPATLTVLGSGFVDVSVVHVDGIPAATTFVSTTRLTAPYTATAAGSHDVTVVNNLQTSNAVPIVVTLPPPPALVSIAPPWAVATNEKTFTITGTGFGATTTVYVDGIAVPTTVVSATQATVTYRGTADGPVDVTAQNGGSVPSNALVLQVDAFDPTTVPGLATWIDPDDPTTYIYSAGLEISQWNARFGTAQLPQTVITKQPQVVPVGLDGSAYVYAGPTETLGTWGPPASYDWDTATEVLEVFVVSQRVATNTGGGGNTYYYYDDFAILSHHNFQPGVGYRTASWNEYASAILGVDNAWHLVEWTVQPGVPPSIIKLVRSGVDSGFTSYGGSYTPALTHFLWIADQTDAAYNNAASHADILIFATPAGVAAPDRRRILDWLTAKWPGLWAPIP